MMFVSLYNSRVVLNIHEISNYFNYYIVIEVVNMFSVFLPDFTRKYYKKQVCQ